jgi:16S rRNA (guanine(527)-N(7))-methyltransferase RsmG
MNIESKATFSPAMLWQAFAERHSLSEQQVEQFKKFYEMVIESNENFNLTAIDSLPSFIALHFDDSLVLGDAANLVECSMLADVGTGAGFPGLALKIRYPHLKIILIEVTQKKIAFLYEVISALSLKDVEIFTLDWRTFLRTTSYPINIVCSRASLHPTELLRMFQPGSPYKYAQLVYWGSMTWQPQEKEVPFLQREFFYTVNNKQRKLVFFGKNA